ncbi:MAG: hypothetical protein U5Q16_16905 [Gammaproteobacteria bacterium]|nr:hypothetical protein [Gammaproteobacteria bacterium]
MSARLSLQYSLDWLFALVTVAAVAGVLQTFIIGRHFIIPTAIAALAVLTGNLSWYGFRDHAWAKYVLFWAGVLVTAHGFFALFWAKKYRELLGGAFEPVCAVLTLVLAFLVIQYARRNRLFSR